MTETLRYTQLGKQDIRFGTGTFKVTLADGSVTTLDELSWRTIQTFLDANYIPVFTGGELTTLAARSDNVVALILGELTVSSTLSLPSNVAVRLTGNSQITISSGVTLTTAGPVFVESALTAFSGSGTLTINGPFSAPLRQVYGSGLTVTFGTPQTVFPEWWGIDGTADDVQINAAIGAGSGMDVVLQPTTYTVAASIELDVANSSLRCPGGLATLAASTNIDIVTVSANQVKIGRVRASQSNGTPTKAGFRFTNGCKTGVFDNLDARGNKYGYELFADSTNAVLYNKFFGCSTETTNTDNGIYIHTTDDGAVNENTFLACDVHAATTSVPVVIESNGTKTPNQNKFIACSLEGGSSTDFAVKDFGLNSWVQTRMETNGRGMYFENASGTHDSVARAHANYLVSTKFPRIVLKTAGSDGRLNTDSYWGRAFSGIVYGNGYTATTVDGDSSSGQTVLNVADTSTFLVGMPVIINEGGEREEWGQVASVQAGVSITLQDTLENTHTAAQADAVQAFGKPSGLVASHPEDFATVGLYSFGELILTLTRNGEIVEGTPAVRYADKNNPGGGNRTLTAANLLGGLIDQDPAGSATWTTPDAATIVAGLDNPKVGHTITTFLHNNATAASSEVVTIAAGSGVTLKGTTFTLTEGTNETALLVCRLTNVTSGAEAVDCYILTHA